MPKKVEKTPGISDDAVKTKTRKGWQQWFKILDDAKANQLSHKEIAEFLAANYGKDVGPWYQQMITVQYERVLQPARNYR